MNFNRGPIEKKLEFQISQTLEDILPFPPYYTPPLSCRRATDQRERRPLDTVVKASRRVLTQSVKERFERCEKKQDHMIIIKF